MNIPYLTLNKVYDVYKIGEYTNGNKCYEIMNDNGIIDWYNISFFTPLAEWRNKQIDLILEDD
jgi:hypothetical protein